MRSDYRYTGIKGIKYSYAVGNLTCVQNDIDIERNFIAQFSAKLYFLVYEDINFAIRQNKCTPRTVKVGIIRF